MRHWRRDKLHLEVDQSVKMEQSGDTTLAYSNDEQRVILIPAGVKREVLHCLRRQGRRDKAAILLMFTAGLFLLLRDVVERAALVIIDQEYEGNEGMIKNRLLQMLWADQVNISPNSFAFGNVGRQSQAHQLAIMTNRGQRLPDHRVTLAEMLAVLE
jgi:hypothetical protein